MKRLAVLVTDQSLDALPSGLSGVEPFDDHVGTFASARPRWTERTWSKSWKFPLASLVRRFISTRHQARVRVRVREGLV
jgi:hypothetical protein